MNTTDVLNNMIDFLQKFDSEKGESKKLKEFVNTNERKRDVILNLFKADLEDNKELMQMANVESENFKNILSFKVLKYSNIAAHFDEMTTEDRQTLFSFLLSFKFVEKAETVDVDGLMKKVIDNDMVKTLIQGLGLHEFSINDFISEEDIEEIKKLLKDHEHLMEHDFVKELLESKILDNINISTVMSDIKNPRSKIYKLLMKAQETFTEENTNIDMERVNGLFTKLSEKLMNNSNVKKLVKRLVKTMSRNKAFKQMLKQNNLSLDMLMSGDLPSVLGKAASAFGISTGAEETQEDKDEARRKRREKARKKYRRDMKEKLKKEKKRKH